MDKVTKNKSVRQPGRSCAIIINGDKILLIKRHCEARQIKDYYIIPGGGIEGNETPKQAILREAKEELSIDIQLSKELFSFVNFGGLERYFLVKSYSGTVNGSNEISMDNSADTYEIIWHPLSTLHDINILPDKAKQLIIDYARSQGIVKG